MNAIQTQTSLRVIGAADFEPEVLQSKQPVLVAFFAPWSRPCQVLDAALRETTAACGDRAKIVKVNADDNPELSLYYDIQSIPTLLYFVEGVPCLRIVGTATKEAILGRLEPFGVAREGVALASATSGAGHKPGKV